MATQAAYGNDDYCQQARALIAQHVEHTDIAVHFVASGTLANIIMIANALRPHEAVIATQIGHAVVRETGAIEATGHKIITVPSDDGKLTTNDIEVALANNAHFPHMAKPRLVYISNTTEVGTVYNHMEIAALSALCKAKGLLLMLDGARLGTAVTAINTDLTLQHIANLTDMFWIGGTKAGALLGEAIVIPNKTLATEFEFHIKQRGALLAKGRVLGLQFIELFTNELFFDLSRHANAMAQQLSAAIELAGFTFAANTESNQLFPILPNAIVETLQEEFDFYVWGKADEQHSIVRLVTSWATNSENVERLIKKLNR